MNRILQHIISALIAGCFSMLVLAQDKTPASQERETLKAYNNALKKAQTYASDKDFQMAEASYKKAIALKPENPKAVYNLGNLYYANKKKFNAVEQYKKAVELATTKGDKHRAYHNMGNTYLENKQYAEAVAAYKQALRNDPTDDETRYNLALAKQEQEKNGGGGGDGNNKDKNGGNDGDGQDNKEGDKDKNADGRNKGDQNKKDGNDKDGGDGDKKDSDKGKNTQGDNGNGKPNEQQGGKAPKREEGKLTPQQVKQLLDAMNNEEQKVQGKVKGKETKGTSSKKEKDW